MTMDSIPCQVLEKSHFSGLAIFSIGINWHGVRHEVETVFFLRRPTYTSYTTYTFMPSRSQLESSIDNSFKSYPIGSKQSMPNPFQYEAFFPSIRNGGTMFEDLYGLRVQPRVVDLSLIHIYGNISFNLWK